MNNNNTSLSVNQAIFRNILNTDSSIITTLSGWADRSLSKIGILNYIIKSVSVYGSNSHPSQTTIGKKAGVNRVWVNKVTNELVSLGIIKKERVIKDGKETSCLYSLSPFLLDSKIGWTLREILPALKLLYIFSKKSVVSQTDTTRYITYMSKNFKILNTNSKSIFRSKKVELYKKRGSSMAVYNPTNSNAYNPEISKQTFDESLRRSNIICGEIAEKTKESRSQSPTQFKRELLSHAQSSGLDDAARVFLNIFMDNAEG